MPPKSRQSKQEWLQCVYCKHLFYHRDTDTHLNECSLNRDLSTSCISGDQLNGVVVVLNDSEGRIIDLITWVLSNGIRSIRHQTSSAQVVPAQVDSALL